MKTAFSFLFRQYGILLLSIGFALAVLIVRVGMAKELFFLFLVWNLFLAGIPFAISQIQTFQSKFFRSRLGFFLGFSSWLLFLPNGPYIITDLIHLHNEHAHLMWLDLFLVFVFALNGLLLGLFSLRDMFVILRKKYGPKVAHMIIFICCLLSGFGIYLGRFLRFNSWDVITKPVSLIYRMLHCVTDFRAWFATLAFGGLLWILFLMHRAYSTKLDLGWTVPSRYDPF